MMTGDCFATLEIPQAVVLDSVLLKDAWHRASSKASELEEIHRAYAVLRDPARRISHLLELHGRNTATSEKPGASLFDLFFQVAAVLKKADGISQQMDAADSALQRAALTSPLLSSLDELTVLQHSIDIVREEHLVPLNAISTAFPNLSEPQWETLAALGSDFTFLTKWSAEISKRETRLRETLIGRIV